jgi:site-specific DNA-methyltransferase (cytosine-N4-specific)
VLSCYATQKQPDGPRAPMALEPQDGLSNVGLFAELVRRGVICATALSNKEPIGKAGARHSKVRRAVRWSQQTLRQLGLLERGTARGVWKLTDAGRSAAGLTEPPRDGALVGRVLLAFGTRFGLAVWGRAADAFRCGDEPIDLCITSPPYPLRQPRRYGNPRLEDYVDSVCDLLEPIVARLRPAGSIALNVSNDIFMAGSPERSLYRERLIIALFERLGLRRLDEIPWVNRSKPPGPVAWASKSRVQLNTGWEPIYVLSPDPRVSMADNRRVLQPHTARHMRFVANGGERRDCSHSDNAYVKRPGAYARPTDGAIPKNVIEMGHRCTAGDSVRALARRAGLPVHGAPMPLALADFLVRWLCPPGSLVVDPCAGTLTTAQAAEQNGCYWFCSEQYIEYLVSGSARFERIFAGPALA